MVGEYGGGGGRECHPKNSVSFLLFFRPFSAKKVFGLEMFPTCVSSEHCALFLLCTSELLAEEEIHVLSLRWLTLLVQVAHLSIRAIFIRAAFWSLATGKAASDRVGGSQFSTFKF